MSRPNNRELYNKEFKDRYLNRLMPTTRSAYEQVLSKAFSMEKEWNKDLYDFNVYEMDLFFESFRVKSYMSAIFKKSVITDYIKFAFDEKYIKNLNILLNPLLNNENLKNYVNNEWAKNKIIDKETLFKEIIEDDYFNYQDVIIPALIFVGVWGSRSAKDSLDELINLKKRDVDYHNGILTLTRNNGDIRQISISKDYLSVIEGASEQARYKKTVVDESKMLVDETELYDGEYIIKPSKRKDSKEQISAQNIRQRFNKIRDYYNSYLVPTAIREAGMIDLLKTLKGDNVKEIDDESFKVILKQFGLNKNTRQWVLRNKLNDYLKI